MRDLEFIEDQTIGNSAKFVNKLTIFEYLKILKNVSMIPFIETKLNPIPPNLPQKESKQRSE